MTTETIKDLCCYLEGNSPAPTKASTALYLKYRHNPAFGWFFASELVRRRLNCPVTMGDDNWLSEAYLHCLGQGHSQDISMAQHIHERRDGESEMAVLRGLLLGRDATIESVAKETGYPERVVGAYERLFFNILDRKNDEIYLAKIAYPNGRVEEFFDGYARSASLTDLIIRAGFNNGSKDVLYLAGLRSDLLTDLQKDKSVPQNLEGRIVANGHLLARNGWLNQKGDATGLTRAQASLAASKKKDEALPQMNSPFAGIGESLFQEMKRVKTQEAIDRLARRSSIAADRSKAPGAPS